MPNRFRRPRVVGQRRLTQWVAPALQEFVTVASTTKVIISSFDAQNFALLRPTVVRTRGEIAIRASTYAADLNIVGAFGICVVSTDAFAAGVASIPGPFTDAEWNGWFVWRSFSYVVEQSSDVGVMQAAKFQEIDSKAMRKIATNETIVQVAESFLGTFQISTPLRMLLKLS